MKTITALEFQHVFSKELEESWHHFLNNFPNDRHSLDEWVAILVAWMELSNKEDAERFYPTYYE